MRKLMIQKFLERELKWINYKLWKTKGKSRKFRKLKAINLKKQELWEKKRKEMYGR